MSDKPNPPPAYWQQRVAGPYPYPRQPYSPSFTRGTVTLGAIHGAGVLAGLLAADKMKEPQARWSAILGFGVATGIGEQMWRERVAQERARQNSRKPE